MTIKFISTFSCNDYYVAKQCERMITAIQDMPQSQEMWHYLFNRLCRFWDGRGNTVRDQAYNINALTLPTHNHDQRMMLDYQNQIEAIAEKDDARKLARHLASMAKGFFETCCSLIDDENLSSEFLFWDPVVHRTMRSGYSYKQVRCLCKGKFNIPRLQHQIEKSCHPTAYISDVLQFEVHIRSPDDINPHVLKQHQDKKIQFLQRVINNLAASQMRIMSVIHEKNRRRLVFWVIYQQDDKFALGQVQLNLGFLPLSFHDCVMDLRQFMNERIGNHIVSRNIDGCLTKAFVSDAEKIEWLMTGVCNKVWDFYTHHSVYEEFQIRNYSVPATSTEFLVMCDGYRLDKVVCAGQTLIWYTYNPPIDLSTMCIWYNIQHPGLAKLLGRAPGDVWVMDAKDVFFADTNPQRCIQHAINIGGGLLHIHDCGLVHGHVVKSSLLVDQEDQVVLGNPGHIEEVWLGDGFEKDIRDYKDLLDVLLDGSEPLRARCKDIHSIKLILDVLNEANK